MRCDPTLMLLEKINQLVAFNTKIEAKLSAHVQQAIQESPNSFCHKVTPAVLRKDYVTNSNLSKEINLLSKSGLSEIAHALSRFEGRYSQLQGSFGELAKEIQHEITNNQETIQQKIQSIEYRVSLLEKNTKNSSRENMEKESTLKFQEKATSKLQDVEDEFFQAMKQILDLEKRAESRSSQPSLQIEDTPEIHKQSSSAKENTSSILKFFDKTKLLVQDLRSHIDLCLRRTSDLDHQTKIAQSPELNPTTIFNQDLNDIKEAISSLKNKQEELESNVKTFNITDFSGSADEPRITQIDKAEKLDNTEAEEEDELKLSYLEDIKDLSNNEAEIREIAHASTETTPDPSHQPHPHNRAMQSLLYYLAQQKQKKHPPIPQVTSGSVSSLKPLKSIDNILQSGTFALDQYTSLGPNTPYLISDEEVQGIGFNPEPKSTSIEYSSIINTAPADLDPSNSFNLLLNPDNKFQLWNLQVAAYVVDVFITACQKRCSMEVHGQQLDPPNPGGLKAADERT
ncbi:hypothetical protein MJO28_013210 [Puccinia striiformis f. sp. tritici]|uniref:Uncharacterized protein n=1 Tax=Puccinia striiformis f. sp. tritici TaxID=168172 RepID=A0ACC0DYS1_9BASI|nr:hypothetical protein MJO28_013210 [Puccinia striiformis f. sp. tritici]